jgi:hypothetical protein
MKKAFAFIIPFILLFSKNAFAQNITANMTTNTTAQMAGMSLPFIGEITLIGGIVGIILFIIGYFIGSALKSGIKYAFIFLLFIIILYVLGFLSKEIITRIGEGIGVLKSFYSGFQSNFGMGSGALNLQIVLFVLGLIVGLWKG